MYNFLSKNGQLFAFLLGLIITVIFLFSVFGGLDEFNALAEEQRGTTGIFDFGLYAAIGLTILCGVLALLFGLGQTLFNPKGAIKGIIGLAVLAAVYFIGQSMAGVDTAGVINTMKEFGVTGGQSSFINGAIGGGLILLGIAAVVFVISELLNFFK